MQEGHEEAQARPPLAWAADDVQPNAHPRPLRGRRGGGVLPLRGRAVRGEPLQDLPAAHAGLLRLRRPRRDDRRVPGRGESADRRHARQGRASSFGGRGGRGPPLLRALRGGLRGARAGGVDGPAGLGGAGGRLATTREARGGDFEGLGRAGWTDLRAWEVQEGGSTISEQLMKNLFVDEDKRLDVSFWRRFVQSSLAFSYERRHNKDEILTAYLNTVYYGDGAYGAERAAQRSFGKGARGNHTS